MIVYSTPSSIAWEADDGRRITFHGEWTLEPKFYLYVPEEIYWNDAKPSVAILTIERDNVIKSLLSDAQKKGWVIEVE